MRDAALALDVGGTRVKALWQDEHGRRLHEWIVATPAHRNPLDTIHAIADLAASSIRRAPEDVHPVAVGIAIPGLVDEKHGIAFRSENLGWRDIDLAAIFRDRTLLPVAVSQDVRAGARAESHSGAARGVSSALFVPIGTGIGAALITDGTVRGGPNNRAGEIGHLPVDGSWQPCLCGRHGCLEAIASATAIRSRYNERADSAVDGAAEVISRAARGDGVAVDVWREAISALGAALSAADRILDLDCIVIGGGLSLAGESVLEPLRIQLALRGSASTTVISAHHRDFAGAIGAGFRAWQVAQ